MLHTQKSKIVLKSRDRPVDHGTCVASLNRVKSIFSIRLCKCLSLDYGKIFAISIFVLVHKAVLDHSLQDETKPDEVLQPPLSTWSYLETEISDRSYVEIATFPHTICGCRIFNASCVIPQNPYWAELLPDTALKFCWQEQGMVLCQRGDVSSRIYNFGV